jgi:hypothetical protein
LLPESEQRGFDFGVQHCRVIQHHVQWWHGNWHDGRRLVERTRVEQRLDVWSDDIRRLERQRHDRGERRRKQWLRVAELLSACPIR